MADQTSPKDKSVEKAEEPKEAEGAAPEEPETVTLFAESLPFLVSSFRLPQEDGSMLSFDKNGTEVPAADADSLTEAALEHGVSLTRKA